MWPFPGIFAGFVDLILVLLTWFWVWWFGYFSSLWFGGFGCWWIKLLGCRRNLVEFAVLVVCACVGVVYGVCWSCGLLLFSACSALESGICYFEFCDCRFEFFDLGFGVCCMLGVLVILALCGFRLNMFFGVGKFVVLILFLIGLNVRLVLLLFWIIAVMVFLGVFGCCCLGCGICLF